MKADLPTSEKERIIEEEFMAAGYDLNRRLTREQLQDILDEKTGHAFDDRIFDELYSQMRKEPTGETTLIDFKDVWIQADNSLRSKIEIADRVIEENVSQKEEAANRLEEAKSKEKMNANGIMENSHLIVKVLYARDLFDQTGQPFQPMVTLESENQRYETEAVADNSEYFEWAEDFNIPIQHTNSNLTVCLCNHFGDPELHLNIPLEKLRDQIKKDQEFQMSYMDGRQSETVIGLQLQWIHSYVKFLTDVIQNWDNTIKEQKDNKDVYVDSLNVIYEPFDNLRHLQIPRQQKIAYNNSNIYTETNRREAKFASVPAGKSTLFQQILFWLMVSLLFLSLFHNFHRCVFYDTLIALCFLSSSFLDLPPLIKAVLFFLIVFIGFTLILDLYWIFKYTTAFWSDIYIDAKLQIWLRRSTVFIAYLTFILKVFYELTLKIVIAVISFLLMKTAPSRPVEVPYQNMDDKSDPYNPYPRNGDSGISNDPFLVDSHDFDPMGSGGRGYPGLV